MVKLTLTLPNDYHARVAQLLTAIKQQTGARLTMGALLAAAFQATDDRSVLASALAAQIKLKARARVRHPSIKTLRRHLRAASRPVTRRKF